MIGKSIIPTLILLMERFLFQLSLVGIQLYRILFFLFRLAKQLLKLKYTVIEPNPETVPNNKWNIDAASIFILSRDRNYREKIIENCPAVL